jgi:hypothetical protein
MASAWKSQTLLQRSKRANHGRKPARGRPRSRFKRQAMGVR